MPTPAFARTSPLRRPACRPSSTFVHYFIAYGDCFDSGKEFVETLPIDLASITPQRRTRLVALAAALMADMQKNAVRRRAFSKKTGRMEYDEFWPRLSKPIIDEIDRVLAEHYGFTDEELDFIINYDIKYRMGRDDGAGDDGPPFRVRASVAPGGCRMLDRGAKPIRWTPDAVENLSDRDIPQEEIERTIAEPEGISPGKIPGRSIYLRRYHDPTLDKLMLLLVVTEETATERVVVTVITTSRPQRYLRGQP